MFLSDSVTGMHGLHPIVAIWFARRFGAPTDAQAAAWPLVAEGKNVLITAPTGSGKTLAAFLICIDRLVRHALDGSLGERTHVVYVSPLKALSNDVHRNLVEPLREIEIIAQEMGVVLPTIRTSVRTGDTSMQERRAAVKHPPHILVTTPESLYILLTSESGRRGLSTASTLIVDEIHAIASDKRGAHLSLSIERLERLTGAPLQRIGLSATVHPIDVASRLLCGDRPAPEVVNAIRKRDLDLAISIPQDELGAVATIEQWEELYERITELVRTHRSTLVFVNTRRLVERVSHNLAARLGEQHVGAHHGSLSRERRFKTEQRLKAGDLQVVVATASLELGIDIGAVDLVCLVGSPRTIATGVQRIGRSGHNVGGTPKGRFFPLTRDQLVECAALVRSARAGELDRIYLRQAPLDILSQQIVAACSCEEWSEDELFATLRKAGPYATLEREHFDAVVDMLSEGIATARGRSGALLHRDGVARKLRGRRGARLTAITSGGAIPDLALFDVIEAPSDTLVGTLDEDFAIESMAGDIVLLGNTSWRILRIENGKVRVENAAGLPPTVPFWFGEGPARSFELSHAVGDLRQEIAQRLTRPSDDPNQRSQELLDWLIAECALDRGGAELIAHYIAAGNQVLGGVPAQDCVIAERFFDESGGTQLIIHAPFGGRINRAWGSALRKRFCRSFDFELQAAATDEGVLLSLGPQHSFPLEMILEMVHPNALDELMTQAALQSPLFETRWRWNATRSLALRRSMGGKRVPPNLQRMRSQDLLAACFPQQLGCQDNHGGMPIEVPDHPLVKETLYDCLNEAMDIEGLRRVLTLMGEGKIRRLARETPEPSVFAHEILNANPYAFLDDAPLEERRARAVAMRRGLPAMLTDDLGQLDPGAVALVCEEAQPVVRDADELHDLLLDVGVWPDAEGARRGWLDHLDRLVETQRAGRLHLNGHTHWVAAERLTLIQTVWPDAVVFPRLTEPPARKAPAFTDRDGAITEIVRGHMVFSPPTTASELGARLGIATENIDAAFVAIELQGQIMRGQFRSPAHGRNNAGENTEWFHRSLLARANRITVQGLRRQIEPVSAADLMRFLFTWQHLASTTALHGRDGLLEIVGQLQGFEAAAGAWERDILPARVTGYDPGWLDDLCLGGQVVWGRLARRAEAGRSPTRTAPIALVVRRDLPALLVPDELHPNGDDGTASLSAKAKDVLLYLQQAGASFLDDIATGIRRVRAEVEDGLWELVATGIVTGDGFTPLRALLLPGARRPSRPRWYGSSRSATRLGTGRWSLLRPRVSVLPPTDTTASVEAQPQHSDRVMVIARQFIRRYGIVFRDLLARETHAPPWRDLVRAYRSMEMRGELRGGRLVTGFVGEQFAAPEAVDALRAMRNRPKHGDRVRVSACDPLNLVGITSPGARATAQLGRHVTYIDGIAERLEDTQESDIDPDESVSENTELDLTSN